MSSSKPRSTGYPSFIDVNVLVVVVNASEHAHVVAESIQPNGQTVHRPISGRVIRGERSLDAAIRVAQDLLGLTVSTAEQLAVFEQIATADDGIAHDLDIVYGVRLLDSLDRLPAVAADPAPVAAEMSDPIDRPMLLWRPVRAAADLVPLAPDLLQPVITDWLRPAPR